MTAWTSDELSKIGMTDEIDIAPYRRAGTLRQPVTVWIVRVGDDLYVCSYRGPDGFWFRAVQVRNQGRIWARSIEKDVTLTPEIDPDINDQIDTAYRTKYGRYPQYVAPMVTAEARATTLRVLPL